VTFVAQFPDAHAADSETRTQRSGDISDLAATIYHLFGIDPRAQLYDIQGQLRFICDGQPVMELF
jgi:hypothetical protein